MYKPLQEFMKLQQIVNDLISDEVVKEYLKQNKGKILFDNTEFIFNPNMVLSVCSNWENIDKYVGILVTKKVVNVGDMGFHNTYLLDKNFFKFPVNYKPIGFTIINPSIS